MMRQSIYRKWLAASALILCFMITAGFTAAYFTDHEAARGGATVDLSGKTELHEVLEENNKLLTIENTGETDMVVRAAVFGDEDYLQVLQDADRKWVQGETDGFWYYTEVLRPGETTTELKAEVKARAEGTGLPDIDFDIVAVHESSRVSYTGDTVNAPDGWTDFPEIQAPKDLQDKAA